LYSINYSGHHGPKDLSMNASFDAFEVFLKWFLKILPPPQRSHILYGVPLCRVIALCHHGYLHCLCINLKVVGSGGRYRTYYASHKR
jgi:hypothetical protein